MIQTDRCYERPVVYKMITSGPDKFIQLDTFKYSSCHSFEESADKVLGNTHLKPVSFVSNNAGVYRSDMWCLPPGIAILGCRFLPTLFTYYFTIMFFQVANVQSSNIAELFVNPATSEVIVEFKSGGSYSYTNVDRVAIDDLLYARADLSLGQWVNANLAKDSAVICDNLNEFIRNIQREPIAAW